MRSSKVKTKRVGSKSTKRYIAIKEESRAITGNLKKNGLAHNDTEEIMAGNLDFDISKTAGENLLHKEQYNGSLKSDTLSAGITTLEQKETVSSNVPDTKSITKIERLKPTKSKYIAKLFKIFKNTQ